MSKSLNSIVEGVEPVLVDSATDNWGVIFKFKCLNCGNKYYITETDKEICEKFGKSLEDGHPNRYIGCAKCDENIKILN